MGHGSKPAAAGLLLLARRAGYIDLLLPAAVARQQRRAAGKCGQCHVVSISK